MGFKHFERNAGKRRHARYSQGAQQISRRTVNQKQNHDIGKAEKQLGAGVQPMNRAIYREILAQSDILQHPFPSLLQRSSSSLACSMV